MNREIGNVAGVSIMVSPEAYEDIKKQKTIYENEILTELQQRIDEAIEYIEKQKYYDDIDNCAEQYDLGTLEVYKLLDILRGNYNE